MDNRCETCRHWWNPTYSEEEGTWGLCLMTESLPRWEPRRPETRAYATVTDPEGEPYLLTRPDFGCVQWQASRSADG